MTDTNATDAPDHQDDNQKYITDEEHIANILEELRKSNYNFDQGQYADFFNKDSGNQERGVPDKENCIHEIIITVQYQVIATDHKKKELGCVEAIDDRYIIPVAVAEDYKPFIDKFKEHLNKSLAEAAKDVDLPKQ
jgi:hypothetical protein